MGRSGLRYNTDVASAQFEHVTKTYGKGTEKVRAVRNLDLTVVDRELLVLVGPSGCGKTTTLRLIAGLERPASGVIRIDNRDVTDVAPRDRDVAMVFQNYALYPHMTVYKNMAFGLRMRRVPKERIKRKVEETARLLDIEPLLNRKPATLSGGEQQRVAVGRAIVRNPKLFLFDEPLANLDVGLRQRMRTEIKSLQRELETTMIYVTHDQEEAMTLGDRIAVMNAGTLHQCGPPLEVYNRPLDRFVAGFLGTATMNFLDGRLEGTGESLAFVSRAGRLTLPRERTEQLAQHLGRAVVLGIRPEHVSIVGSDRGRDDTDATSPASPGAVLSDLLVRVVEPLGDRVHVHFASAQGDRMVGTVPSTTVIEPGLRVDIRCDMSRAHFFEPDERERRLDGA